MCGPVSGHANYRNNGRGLFSIGTAFPLAANCSGAKPRSAELAYFVNALRFSTVTGWVHSKPVEPALAGGDVYYLSVCSAGLLSRIVLADVAGHGQQVDAAAMTLRDLLRKHVNAFDQSELMRGINEAFAKGLDGAVQYATAAVLGYYRATRQLIFANAGLVWAT